MDFPMSPDDHVRLHKYPCSDIKFGKIHHNDQYTPPFHDISVRHLFISLSRKPFDRMDLLSQNLWMYNKKFMLHHLSSILTYSLYSASGLYAGRMILSTFLSSSRRCALHPTIRAAAKDRCIKVTVEDPAYYIQVRCRNRHSHFTPFVYLTLFLR